jgi:hypothetical protein
LDLRRLLGLGLRIAVAGVAYLTGFLVSYGLVMPAVPPDPSASPIPPGVAILLVAALHTAIMAWLILRSRWTGWRLAATMIVVFFGVQSLLPQVESWIFQASPGYASHLPARMIPRILMAGLIHACLWIPLAILILGRWRAHRPSPPRAPGAGGLWGWKVPAAAVAYVVLYFVFGYYVAWRNPAVTAYYQGTDPGTFWRQLQSVLRDTPWLPLVQGLRGLAWAVLGVIVLRSMRGPIAERALAVASLFAIVMNASLLLPNPYMPYDVRMVHLVETASSNFLFGLLVAWMFGPAAPAARSARGRVPRLAGKLNDHLAAARMVVAVDQDHLLPRAQEKVTVGHGHHQRGSEEAGPHVGMAVAVVPRVLVVVAHGPGGQALQGGGQVAAQPGLELDGGDGGCRAGHEHQDLAVIEVVPVDEGLHVRSQVPHVVVAAGLEGQPFGDPHGHASSSMPTMGSRIHVSRHSGHLPGLTSRSSGKVNPHLRHRAGVTTTRTPARRRLFNRWARSKAMSWRGMSSSRAICETVRGRPRRSGTSSRRNMLRLSLPGGGSAATPRSRGRRRSLRWRPDRNALPIEVAQSRDWHGDDDAA